MISKMSQFTALVSNHFNSLIQRLSTSNKKKHHQDLPYSTFKPQESFNSTNTFTFDEQFSTETSSSDTITINTSSTNNLLSSVLDMLRKEDLIELAATVETVDTLKFVKTV